jgi:hypothetical protein
LSVFSSSDYEYIDTSCDDSYTDNEHDPHAFDDHSSTHPHLSAIYPLAKSDLLSTKFYVERIYG